MANAVAEPLAAQARAGIIRGTRGMTTVALRSEWRNAAVVVAAASALMAVAPRQVQVSLLILGTASVLAWWTLSGAARWLFLFAAGTLLLPPLPASFGDSGPHLALAFAALGLVAGAFRWDEWAFGGTAVVAPAAALGLVLLASVSMALLWSGPTIAAGSAVRAALFAIGPFALAFIVCGPGRALLHSGLGVPRFLLCCGVASALFACIDFAFQFPAPAGYGAQFVWVETGVFRRAQGLFYDAGALGNMCAFFLTMVATAALFRTRWRVANPWLLGAAAVPLATALVLSYSRAAFLNVITAMVALLWLQRGRVRWVRASVMLAALSLGLGVGVYFLAPHFTALWWERLQHSFMFGSTSIDRVLSGRVSTWQLLASFIVENPLRILLGIGYKTLPYSDVLGNAVIADNTYLSTFIETGVIGFAALIALHASVLRSTARAAKSADPSAAFYGAWACAFWAGEMVQMMAADLLTYWRLLPLFFFAIGMAVLKSREERT